MAITAMPGLVTTTSAMIGQSDKSSTMQYSHHQAVATSTKSSVMHVYARFKNSQAKSDSQAESEPEYGAKEDVHILVTS